jgi:RNA polymerase sigma-70 factor (ECF subfamily)
VFRSIVVVRKSCSPGPAFLCVDLAAHQGIVSPAGNLSQENFATDDQAARRLPCMTATSSQGYRTGAERSDLAALFDSTFDNVYRFVLSRSASEHVAEDVAAETFAEAARSFGEGRGDEVTIGWLITVARRRLIDHWRREHRHEQRAKRWLQSTIETDGAAHAPDFDVIRALRRIPERQRAALTLRYLDDLSVAEVADALECSYEAVESLLARARRSFAASYEGRL